MDSDGAIVERDRLPNITALGAAPFQDIGTFHFIVISTNTSSKKISNTFGQDSAINTSLFWSLDRSYR